MKCWEFMKCPPKICDECPAYPDRGLDCWKVTGTKCAFGAIEKATLLEKLDYCKRCGYYIEYANHR